MSPSLISIPLVVGSGAGLDQTARDAAAAAAATAAAAVPASQKGAASGVAQLDAASVLARLQVPPAQALPPRKNRIRRAQIQVVTSFASGHGWTGTGGTLSLNTTDPYVPDSSAKLVSTASSSARIISPTLAAINMDPAAGVQKGMVLAYRLSAKGETTPANDIVDITSNAFANFAGPTALADAVYGPADGEWRLIPSQPSSVTASVDMTAITGVRPRIGSNASVTPSLELGLFGTWTLENKTRAAVVIDDGRDDHYEMARRAIAKGVKVTLAIYPGALDTAGSLTVAQARELQDKYGCEIIPHAAYDATDHGNTSLYLDATAFEASLRRCRDKLIEYGLTSGIENYAYGPCYNGNRDSAAAKVADALVRKYFPGLARLALGGFNGQVESQSPFDMERLIRTGMYSNGTNSALSNFQGMLDRAVFMKGCPVFVFHGLNATDAGLYISRASFDALMTELGTTRAATVQSCTFSEAFAA